MTIDFSQWLVGKSFVFMLIFCRVGSALMLFPGVGEAFVLPRLRALLAAAISLVLILPLEPYLPTMPTTAAETVALIIQEVLIGIFFGLILRIFLGTLETAGTIISFQIGLSNATLFNPTMASQGTLTGAILTTTAVTILFVTGYDDTLLRALVGTYGLIPATEPVIVQDLSQQMIKIVNGSFALGTQLAAPFLIIGVVMSVAMGVMAKLMPQIQIFTLAMPVQIIAGLALFAVTITGVLLAWMSGLDNHLHDLKLL